MTRYHHVDVFADAAYTGNSLAATAQPITDIWAR